MDEVNLEMNDDEKLWNGNFRKTDLIVITGNACFGRDSHHHELVPLTYWCLLITVS